MVRILIVVREPGRLKPDYSLEFDLPEVPKLGDYISVQRPDHHEPWGEDMIVRRVWWRLDYPNSKPVQISQVAVGKPREIIIECDPATSSYSSDNWLKYVGPSVEAGKAERFEIARIDVRESQLKE